MMGRWARVRRRAFSVIAIVGDGLIRFRRSDIGCMIFTQRLWFSVHTILDGQIQSVESGKQRGH